MTRKSGSIRSIIASPARWRHTVVPHPLLIGLLSLLDRLLDWYRRPGIILCAGLRYGC